MSPGKVFEWPCSQALTQLTQWMKEDEMCLVKSLGCFIRELKD